MLARHHVTVTGLGKEELRTFMGNFEGCPASSFSLYRMIMKEWGGRLYWISVGTYSWRPNPIALNFSAQSSVISGGTLMRCVLLENVRHVTRSAPEFGLNSCISRLRASSANRWGSLPADNWRMSIRLVSTGDISMCSVHTGSHCTSRMHPSTRMEA